MYGYNYTLLYLRDIFLERPQRKGKTPREHKYLVSAYIKMDMVKKAKGSRQMMHRRERPEGTGPKGGKGRKKEIRIKYSHKN